MQFLFYTILIYKLQNVLLSVYNLMIIAIPGIKHNLIPVYVMLKLKLIILIIYHYY